MSATLTTKRKSARVRRQVMREWGDWGELEVVRGVVLLDLGSSRPKMSENPEAPSLERKVPAFTLRKAG